MEKKSYWVLAQQYFEVTGDSMTEIPGAMLFSLNEEQARKLLIEAIRLKKKIKVILPLGNVNDGESFELEK